MSWNLLTKNGTWELIQKPKKKKIVGYRWSFRIKKKNSQDLHRKRGLALHKSFNQLLDMPLSELSEHLWLSKTCILNKQMSK